MGHSPYGCFFVSREGNGKMPTIDISGNEVEFTCTAYTPVLYEQAFREDPYERVTGDLIVDVMGCQRVSADSIVFADEDGNLTIKYDYSQDNWLAYLRALWAMVRTATEIRRVNGEKVDLTPNYQEWARTLIGWEPDMREVSLLVCNELQRGLFRARADVPEETIQEP